MGQRSSKSSVTLNHGTTSNINTKSQKKIYAKTNNHRLSNNNSENRQTLETSNNRNNSIISSKNISIPLLVGPTINLQIEESPTAANDSTTITHPANALQLSNSISSSLTSVNTNGGTRQIIIKIQLAKMENGNEQQQYEEMSNNSASSVCHSFVDGNSNQIVDAQILNVTINAQQQQIEPVKNIVVASSSSSPSKMRTVGGGVIDSTTAMNNNFNRNATQQKVINDAAAVAGQSTNAVGTLSPSTYNLIKHVSALQLVDELGQHAIDSRKYSEVLQDVAAAMAVEQDGLNLNKQDYMRTDAPITTTTEAETNSVSNCCRCNYTNANTSSSDLVMKSHNGLVKAFPDQPIVHSQIDFVHCLVPDLVKIYNSSFYWGKMNRYEAERLLDGKPEGTFLLRDSAQEEFLFSVTFRRYGRSLHARIEQSAHKFSFDCHDPSVFTARTVTGLLEHYKDPANVMFFEPSLTIPLHRRTAFSLQELARATIVSNITYDGIYGLQLPPKVKSYLKEYHYKQKLRVRPCDDTLLRYT